MEHFEKDKLTQLHTNTMNITALVQQLKTVVNDMQLNIDKIHKLESQVSILSVELQQLRQTVMVMKAMGMGTGPTAH